VTEAEWLGCTDPEKMLEFLKGKASDRKLRLMLCGWSRLNWKWLTQQSRSAVEVAESFADGVAGETDRRSADAELSYALASGQYIVRNWMARLTLEASLDLWEAALASTIRNPKVKSRQIAILGDIFGPLQFRRMEVDPAWLAWNDDIVVKIAKAIYEARAFDRLPVLADALEDAGCDNAELLDHLRGPGPHVRGCWALDVLLGKD
jgi:hypothetical protein